MERARTVFFGSGAFAVPILAATTAAPELALRAVVTAPARPAGRRGELAPTAVARRAGELDIPVLAPERLRDPAFLAALDELAPDVGVLADYGKLLPASVLDRPRHGILNLHPSLLPRHRGAAPIPATLAAGDPVTGVSLFRMDPGMDTGPLVAAVELAVRPGEDAPALEARLAAAAADLLVASIGPYLRGELPLRPQQADGVTVTRPLTREDGRLDPARPAVELERLVRALRPWPGTFVELEGGERLAILEAAVGEGSTGAGATAPPGTLLADGAGLALVAGSGHLRLLTVRPAGGRAMDGAAYVRGRPGLIGTRVAWGPR